MNSVESSDKSCERLKATLTYTQEEAPRDLSSVVSKLVAKPFKAVALDDVDSSDISR